MSTTNVVLMTAIDRSARASPLFATAALIFAVAGVAAWLVPGVEGMITVGIAGTLAVALGMSSLLTGSDGVTRRTKVVAAAGVSVGLLALGGLWITAVLVAAIPA